MKTLVLVAALLAPAVAAAADDAPRRGAIERPLLLPPRDPHPFGAIETRPLWERPPAPLRDFTLQQRAEDALDRGAGRIEDDATFELRQLERGRAFRDPRGYEELTPRERAELDPFRFERDRQERLDERRLRLEREQRYQRRVEREAESLAEVRRRFDEQVNRENHAGGAVVDRQGLELIEKEYRAALDAAAKQHAATTAAIDADAKLTADERAARRTAADRALEEARDAAARRWEERRKAVLGQK